MGARAHNGSWSGMNGTPGVQGQRPQMHHGSLQPAGHLRMSGGNWPHACIWPRSRYTPSHGVVASRPSCAVQHTACTACTAHLLHLVKCCVGDGGHGGAHAIPAARPCIHANAPRSGKPQHCVHGMLVESASQRGKRTGWHQGASTRGTTEPRCIHHQAACNTEVLVNSCWAETKQAYSTLTCGRH